MSIVDKVIAAVTPPESEEQRVAARREAQNASVNCTWLAMVVEHHEQIELAFASVAAAADAASRREAEEWLGAILTAHSIAEEAVLYPALALHGEKSHASAGYTEQSAVKIQMAALADLDPMSQDYLDKLGHIQGAVGHHVYEEESNWFMKLKDKMPDGDALAARYEREFNRYMGNAVTVEG